MKPYVQVYEQEVPERLEELNNVDTSGVADGDTLSYEGDTARWSKKTPSQMRTVLGLVIGTDVQAYDAGLTTWAGKTAPSGTVVGTSDTQTLTNKLISGLSLLTVSKATNYTATLADDVIVCTASLTITLPAVASSTGKVLTIKSNTGGITSIVIDGNASETVDGATTKTLATDLSTVTIVCNGSAWFIQSYYVGGAL